MTRQLLLPRCYSDGAHDSGSAQGHEVSARVICSYMHLSFDKERRYFSSQLVTGRKVYGGAVSGSTSEW